MANNEKQKGMDPGVAQQLSIQTLTAAINSQQLNAAASRNMVAAAGASLTLGIQLGHTGGLRRILGISPLDAAAAVTLSEAGTPSMIASLQAAHRAP